MKARISHRGINFVLWDGFYIGVRVEIFFNPEEETAKLILKNLTPMNRNIPVRDSLQKAVEVINENSELLCKIWERARQYISKGGKIEVVGSVDCTVRHLNRKYKSDYYNVLYETLDGLEEIYKEAVKEYAEELTLALEKVAEMTGINSKKVKNMFERARRIINTRRSAWFHELKKAMTEIENKISDTSYFELKGILKVIGQYPELSELRGVIEKRVRKIKERMERLIEDCVID